MKGGGGITGITGMEGVFCSVCFVKSLIYPSIRKTCANGSGTV